MTKLWSKEKRCFCRARKGWRRAHLERGSELNCTMCLYKTLDLLNLSVPASVISAAFTHRHTHTHTHHNPARPHTLYLTQSPSSLSLLSLWLPCSPLASLSLFEEWIYSTRLCFSYQTVFEINTILTKCKNIFCWCNIGGFHWKLC